VIRVFDLFFSLVGMLFFAIPFVIILIIGFFDTGAPIFRQARVGLNQKTFIIYKFRTMKVDTASLPTHLILSDSVTTIGHFLRKTKLDELPQLWNVLKGDMSLVGSRPCLPSQVDLIQEREKLNVFSVRPGITGLAQIRGVDMSKPELLAKTDAEMIEKFSFAQYFIYIFFTLLGKGSGDRIIGN
jgi:O-antigen biosynthesis protein WbqP